MCTVTQCWKVFPRQTGYSLPLIWLLPHQNDLDHKLNFIGGKLSNQIWRRKMSMGGLKMPPAVDLANARAGLLPTIQTSNTPRAPSAYKHIRICPGWSPTICLPSKYGRRRVAYIALGFAAPIFVLHRCRLKLNLIHYLRNPKTLREPTVRCSNTPQTFFNHLIKFCLPKFATEFIPVRC